MDPALVEEKLESLRRCVRRVETKRPDTAETLADDPDLQDIITLNLIRAVQLSVDLAAHLIATGDVPPPDTMAETFDRLHRQGIIERPLAEQMQRAVGFRNVAVHNYRAIDWAIVFTLIDEDLDDFRAFAQAVASHAGL